MSVTGIDVSSYQSATYSTAGLSFVFVKATEGTAYTNPLHGAQVAHARAANLLVGHYHFGRAGDGAAQADRFLAEAKPVPGDVLAFDWEDSAVSQAERDAFLKRLKAIAPQHKVILYCNIDFWRNHDTESYAADGLWIADPNSPAGHPAISHAWLFHQYSWAGGVDRNVANFPSTQALRDWATSLIPKAPAPAPKPAPAPVMTGSPIPAKPAPVELLADLNAAADAIAKAIKAVEG